MNINKFVGNRLKESRKEKKLTQKEVSKNLGIVLQQYQTYESGRYQLDYEKIIKLCILLDISADYLLGLTDF